MKRAIMQDKVVKKTAPTTVYLPRKQFINFAGFSILNAEELKVSSRTKLSGNVLAGLQHSS